MAEFHKATSPYINTPQVDFYLDLWQPVLMESSENDIDYTIEQQYDERPDLLAYDLYGTPNLWWIFAVRNKDDLIDPIFDFKSGLTIKLPNEKTIQGIS